MRGIAVPLLLLGTLTATETASGAPRIRVLKLSVSNPGPEARLAEGVVVPLSVLREAAPDLTPAACTALGGAFHGVGSACAPANPCPACHGDADCSAAVNFDDINYFVAALAGGSSGWAVHYAGQHGGQPPSCPYGNCDANGDGTVNFDDINPFVAKLVNPPACP